MGVTVKDLREMYEQNYVVRTCVDVEAADIADEWEWVARPGHETNEGQDNIRDQCDALLREPNRQMTGHDLVNTIAKEYLITGDSFNEVVYSNVTQADQHIGLTPVEIWPIDSGTMDVIPADETGKLPDPPLPAYKQKVRGQTVKFTSNEIIHILDGGQTDRLTGTPRLMSAVILVRIQKYGLLYNLKLFTGQKYPRAMLNVGDIGQEDLDALLDSCEDQAVENPNEVMFINVPVASLIKLIDSNRDMEFIDLVRFVERSICAVYRVPPVKLGISETGGAGVIVGRAQLAAYWDGIEEVQRNIAEALTMFFRRHYGLKSYMLRFKSGRPALELEKVQTWDLLVKSGIVTVNEIRKKEGLGDPVPWGEKPPAVAAPLGLSLGSRPQSESFLPSTGEGDGDNAPTPTLPSSLSVSYFPDETGIIKGVAPGRMQDSPLLEPGAERVQEDTRSLLAGSWIRARRRILDFLDDFDMVTTKAEGRRVITLDTLTAEVDKIFGDWEVEAVSILGDGLETAYIEGKIGMATDLEVEELGQFYEADQATLDAMQSVTVTNPIKRFQGAERDAIVDAVQVAHRVGIREVGTIRARIETGLRSRLNADTWELDRIVRTSTHQANSEARLKVLEDSGIDKVKFITSNDRRVRREHRRYHNQIIPVDLARRLLMDINCRCRAVKPSRRPDVAPPPEVVAQQIQEARTSARTLRRGGNA